MESFVGAEKLIYHKILKSVQIILTQAVKEQIYYSYARRRGQHLFFKVLECASPDE